MNFQMLHAAVPQPLGHQAAPPGAAEGASWSCDWEMVSRRLNRYAAALCGNQVEAEDLAQQTLASLLAKRPAKADHMGYARRTLTRLWLDQQRSLRRRFARAVAAASARVGTMVLPHAPAEMHEQVREVREAIDALPPRQRVIITLRLVEGLDYQAIADAMECDVGAVRASLHLARARVRAVLGEKGFDQE